MRIIGGEWRGRKIEEPRGRDVTRPTTDRVREACASMVMSAFDFDLDEVRVLDAFGGTPRSIQGLLRLGKFVVDACCTDYRAAPHDDLDGAPIVLFSVDFYFHATA